jgi:hypothetical protein
VANLDDKDDQGVATIIQLCAYAYMACGDVDKALDLLSMVIEHSDASGMLGRSVVAAWCGPRPCGGEVAGPRAWPS